MRKYERIKTLSSNDHKWKTKDRGVKVSANNKNVKRDDAIVEIYNNSSIQFSVK